MVWFSREAFSNARSFATNPESIFLTAPSVPTKSFICERAASKQRIISHLFSGIVYRSYLINGMRVGEEGVEAHSCLLFPVEIQHVEASSCTEEHSKRLESVHTHREYPQLLVEFLVRLQICHRACVDFLNLTFTTASTSRHDKSAQLTLSSVK